MMTEPERKDAPAGAPRIPLTPPAYEAAKENSSARVSPQPAEIQPDLIENLPPAQPSRKPDPKAKPTWAEWCEWDVFRRLLNDHRLVGHDAAYKLWHWYHNCKDTHGEVNGFRAQAWYVSRKFGWKPATIYAAHRVLFECGYLTWRVTQGCQQIYKALWGIRELPQGLIQGEMPFVVPVESKSAPKGTPEPAKYAPTGIAGVPQRASKCAPTGIPPYTMCELTVTKESVREPSPRFKKREDWMIRRDLAAVRAEKKLTSHHTYLTGDQVANQVYYALMSDESNLLRELANFPPETMCEAGARILKDEAREAAKKTARPLPPPPDPLGPQFGTPEYEKLKQTL